MRNPRERILHLIEEGYLEADDVVTACLKWMNFAEIKEMYQANEWQHIDPFGDDDD